VSPAASPPVPPLAPKALRHRRSARRLTAGQLKDLRAAVAAVQEIGDERGYQYWAGIHGLPLPMWCQHGTELFLPWHRAYLYLFEKQLQDRVPGVTLPWWDWTAQHGEGIPGAYSARKVDGRKNSLFDSPIQKSGRENPAQTRTTRAPKAPGALPTPPEIETVLEERDFLTFQTELEGIHDGVHMWTGGTMGRIPVAAYDPVFWAHHCMIDRVWYLWQLRHGPGVPPALRDRALAPFPMTVRDTLEIGHLGYDYAASTAAVGGP
jgi:tyrosinase